MDPLNKEKFCEGLQKIIKNNRFVFRRCNVQSVREFDVTETMAFYSAFGTKLPTYECDYLLFVTKLAVLCDDPFSTKPMKELIREHYYNHKTTESKKKDIERLLNSDDLDIYVKRDFSRIFRWMKYPSFDAYGFYLEARKWWSNRLSYVRELVDFIERNEENEE